MNRSFFTSTTDSVFAAGSANFATKISASPISFGLSAAQATAYAALNSSFQSAYSTSLTPSTRTKSSVAAKDSSRVPLRQMASDLGKIIDGSPVTNAQRIDLGLAVRPTPAPRPAPGMPNRFTVALAGNGSLTLKWKSNNPKGSSGTMYQIWRRLGAATSTATFTYIGATGQKQFQDSTIPAGTASLTYQLQAVRSTAVGAWAQYNVSFGVSNGGPVVGVVEQVENTAPRLAA